MKRILSITGLIAAIIVGVLLTTNIVAQAHNGQPVASCTGLAVSLTNYESGAGNNVITISANDGVTYKSIVAPFGSSYSVTMPWADTSTWVWSVIVDSNIKTGDPTRFDKSWAGIQHACVETPFPFPTTTTTVAPTTTVPATTTTVPGGVSPSTPDTTPTPTPTVEVCGGITGPPCSTETTVVTPAPIVAVDTTVGGVSGQRFQLPETL